MRCGRRPWSVSVPDYQLLIFDWDGTLVDSIARIVESMRVAADAGGLLRRLDEGRSALDVDRVEVEGDFVELRADLELAGEALRRRLALMGVRIGAAVALAFAVLLRRSIGYAVRRGRAGLSAIGLCRVFRSHAGAKTVLP